MPDASIKLKAFYFGVRTVGRPYKYLLMRMRAEPSVKRRLVAMAVIMILPLAMFLALFTVLFTVARVDASLALRLGKLLAGQTGLRMIEELYDTHRERLNNALRDGDEARADALRRRFSRNAMRTILMAIPMAAETYITKAFKAD